MLLNSNFENKLDIENGGKDNRIREKFSRSLYSILDSFLLISCSVAGLVMV